MTVKVEVEAKDVREGDIFPGGGVAMGPAYPPRGGKVLIRVAKDGADLGFVSAWAWTLLTVERQG